jgi:hypothetical protein
VVYELIKAMQAGITKHQLADSNLITLATNKNLKVAHPPARSG